MERVFLGSQGIPSIEMDDEVIGERIGRWK